MGLQEWKMRKFLVEIESRYTENPYHNNVHAADVVQSSYSMYKNLKDHTRVSKLELLCLLLASAVHDVQHPGVNNEFMINSQSPEAVRYNERSVNENTHVSVAICILEDSNFNALDGLSITDAKRVCYALCLQACS